MVVNKGRELYSSFKEIRKLNNLLIAIIKICFSFYLFSSPAFGGVISISISSETVYFNQSENETILKLIIKNIGNEAAINSEIEVISQYFYSNSTFLGNIKPNEEKEAKIKLLKKKDINPGTYHIGILMRYEDANKYKFSLVTFARIVNEIESYPNFYASLENIRILKDGKIKLRVHNLDEKDKKIKLIFFYPKELRAKDDIKEAVVPSKGEKDLYFEIVNINGLVGSSYFVFVLLEEEKEIGEENLYTSLIAGATVSISEQSLSTEDNRNNQFNLNFSLPIKISIVIILLLLFLFIYFSLKEKSQRGV